jgi:UDP-3-O-[3-hydroxymyristoyl] glucosamine N-acyltransferase
MRLIIIGGGGFGLELYTYISADVESGRLPSNTSIGVIDDNAQCEVMRRVPNARYLGRLADFKASENDRGLIVVGSIGHRKRIAATARSVGLTLGRYVHPTAWVAPNAVLGEGAVVCPHVVISAFANVADNVAINVFGGVGHGASVGEHSVLGPYSVINGDCALGEGCMLGSRATLFPGVKLGRGCTVDAHTAVRMSAGDFKILSTKRQDIVVDNRLAARDLG